MKDPSRSNRRHPECQKNAAILQLFHTGSENLSKYKGQIHKIYWPVLIEPEQEILLYDSYYWIYPKIQDEHFVKEGHGFDVSHPKKASGYQSRHCTARVTKIFRQIRECIPREIIQCHVQGTNWKFDQGDGTFKAALVKRIWSFTRCSIYRLLLYWLLFWCSLIALCVLS